MSRGTYGGGPKDWVPGSGSKSRTAVELERYLKSVVLVDGDGEVDLGRKGPVYIAIVHDGSGFSPAAAIAVDQNMYHDLSGDVLERAYEILQERDMKNETYVKELQEEWGDRWEEILTEAYDGKVFTLKTPVEAASVIFDDPAAKRLLEVMDPKLACEYCGEHEHVTLVHFESSDPPARMCRECIQDREDREDRED